MEGGRRITDSGWFHIFCADCKDGTVSWSSWVGYLSSVAAAVGFGIAVCRAYIVYLSLDLYCHCKLGNRYLEYHDEYMIAIRIAATKTVAHH
jgi:hypothetical protein